LFVVWLFNNELHLKRMFVLFTVTWFGRASARVKTDQSGTEADSGGHKDPGYGK